MANPMLSTALTPNDNIVTQLGIAGAAYPYAPSSSVAGAGAYFADTTGSRLVSGLTSEYNSSGGFSQNIISGSGATVALTAAQSGSTILFDRAAGTIFTLPTPAIGLNYQFLVLTSVTSNNHKIITSAGTVFLKGAIAYGILDTTPGANPGPKYTAADGSTILAITMNGTTTGGLFGTVLNVVCNSATNWIITGNVIASGTIATPFATS